MEIGLRRPVLGRGALPTIAGSTMGSMLPVVRLRDRSGVARLVLRMDGRAVSRFWSGAVEQIWVYVLASEAARPEFENPAPFLKADVDALAHTLEAAKRGTAGRFVIMAGPDPGLVIEILPRPGAHAIRVTLFRGPRLEFEARELPDAREVRALWPARAVRCPTCQLVVTVSLGAPGAVEALDPLGELTRCPTCRFFVISSSIGKKAHVIHESLSERMVGTAQS